MKIRFVIKNLRNNLYVAINDFGEIEFNKRIDAARKFENKTEALTLVARELNGIFQVIEIYIK